MTDDQDGTHALMEWLEEYANADRARRIEMDWQADIARRRWEND